jgi:hypothetical protein
LCTVALFHPKFIIISEKEQMDLCAVQIKETKKGRGWSISQKHNFNEVFTILYNVKAIGLRCINTYTERSPAAPKKEEERAAPGLRNWTAAYSI